jgi:hypothetical protein
LGTAAISGTRRAEPIFFEVMAVGMTRESVPIARPTIVFRGLEFSASAI